jgi:hypothetical protein
VLIVTVPVTVRLVNVPLTAKKLIDVKLVDVILVAVILVDVIFVADIFVANIFVEDKFSDVIVDIAVRVFADIALPTFKLSPTPKPPVTTNAPVVELLEETVNGIRTPVDDATNNDGLVKGSIPTGLVACVR